MSGKRALGIFTLGLALGCWAISIPLRCAGLAAVVGGCSLLEGALCGAALAMVTRERYPLRVYLWLGVAALTLWPLAAAWPPAGMPDVHPWPSAPDLVYNYFDVIRPFLFLLGVPYPFARLGHHAPDATS